MSRLAQPFDAANRVNWIALLRPPVGFRVRSAIGTTFSLDFLALTALLMGLLDEEVGEEQLDDPVSVFQALTLIGSRVRVYVDRAHIDHPPRVKEKARRLFGLYDTIVSDVRLPSGRFHPKLWALEFEPTPDSLQAHGPGHAVCRYRVLCGTRNVTLGTRWELLARVEGEEKGDGGTAPDSLGADVGAFLRTVMSAASPAPPSWGDAFLRRLGRARFPAVRPEEGDVALLWQWPGRASLAKEIGRGREVLLVAPFLGVGFLSDLAERYEKISVVSAPQEINRVWRTEWAGQVSPFVFRGCGADGIGLHAKLLLCESGGKGGQRRTTTMFLGSANGTRRAWGLSKGGDSSEINCEAVLRISPAPTPTQLLALWCDPESPILTRHLPEALGPETDDPEKILEESRERMAGLAFILGVHHGEMVLRCDDRKLVKETLDRLDGLGVEAEVALFACVGRPSSAQPVSRLVAGQISFGAIPLEDRSRFLVIRLRLVATPEQQKQFVLRANIENAGFGDEDARRDAVMDHAVDEQQIEALLLRLLQGKRARLGRKDDDGQDAEDEDPAGSGAVLERRRLTRSRSLTVEDILEGCARNPALIPAVRGILQSLARSVVPPAAASGNRESLLPFWETFEAARRQWERHEKARRVSARSG